ncbi:MAG: hypothetical protein NTY01_19445 [Verrucomicrobia bacterium]|nr:hypothetical protein [Verrucomicrobiota bacterium]
MTTGQTIAATARLWLKRGSPWMARAKRELAAFSPQMVELGLRELFADIAANVEQLERREVPRFTFHALRFTLCHILSGNLPNAGIVSIIVGLLSGARNVVKPAAGDPMPALFIQSLATVNPKLAKCVVLTSNREAYRKAQAVVAYGDDETIATLQAKTKAAFFDFGHRISIGVVNLCHSAFRIPHSAITAAAARDASMWDQQGCMSPQCFYVNGDAAAFAEALAREMERFDRRWPRAALPFEDAAAIARARNEWRFRGRVWASKGSTHWTVVLDERGGWASSPLNRFVFVRPIEGRTGILPVPSSSMDRRDACPTLSTVGFTGFSLKEVVGMAQADRYCLLGEMQRPSLLLTNGSRPRVGDLII